MGKQASRTAHQRQSQWTLRDGAAHNATMDAASAAATRTDRHAADEARRRWARVRPFAEDVLEVAYARLDQPNEVAVATRRLEKIRRYRGEAPRGITRQARVLLAADEVACTQQQLRAWLARLVLGYGRGLSLYQIPELRMKTSYFRHGADVVTVREVEPRSGEVLLAALDVLRDALPSLRFCRLCGRLFFRVKRQEYCRGACFGIQRAREYPRTDRERKTEKKPGERRRGRPRRDYAEENERRHSAWITEVAPS